MDKMKYHKIYKRVCKVNEELVEKGLEWNDIRRFWKDCMRYTELFETHEKHFENKKPNRHDYDSDAIYKRAVSEWNEEKAMTAPNIPGYYRANND